MTDFYMIGRLNVKWLNSAEEKLCISMIEPSQVWALFSFI